MPLRCVVLCLLFLSIIALPAYSQWRFHASVDYLAPIMKRADQYNYAIGGSIGAGMPISNAFELHATLGYTYLQGVRVEDHYLRYHMDDITALPLNLTFQYRIDQLFFLEVAGGPMLLTHPASDFGSHYSAGGGIRYKRFEISGRLMQWNTGGIINFAGLRLTTSL